MLERRSARGLVLIGTLPLLMGFRACDGGYFSTDPAPDMAGDWAVTYDDTLAVDVTIGGAVYHQTLSATGGTFHIDHGGMPFDFSLDCARPEVVCPSEVWTSSARVEQRDPMHMHQLTVRIPHQVCMGMLVPACGGDAGMVSGDAGVTCGSEPICEGAIATEYADTIGSIAANNRSFDVFLGAGFASNGLNCALLGVSSARADLVTSGSSADPATWEALETSNGEIRVAYAGGCLWAGDPGMTGEVQALVLGANVVLRTGFHATRATR